MFFLMKDEKLLIKYKEIWSEMLKIMKRKKSIAAKCLVILATNTWRPEQSLTTTKKTNFHRKVSEEGFECVCLPEMVIDSLFNSGENYCPQTLLEECKYKVKERELKWFIRYDQESSSDDDSEEEDFKKNSD